MAWLVSGSPDGIDMAMAGLLVVLGTVFLGSPAACMWVALVRLVARPPHGAKLMIGSLRTVGGFLLMVALPTMSVRAAILVSVVVAGVALAFLGVAQLLAAATRSATPQGL
ncbi:hypothetical protein GCM10009559_74620 [Pseudonocardia zijingensis]|uniref:ATP synthase protein I n=1 Tax=Pseudonocardia zijingensis TaxID=153376 RepID=A0ABN1NG25_9PSEU